MNRWQNLYSTYSIVAYDPASGQLGVAVETHQMCVGQMVPTIIGGVGAVASQSLVNLHFGSMALSMLQRDIPVEHVMAALLASDPGAHHRQVAVIDAKGRVAAHTGDRCIAYAGHHVGEGYSVQANMMQKPTVIEAMRTAYEGTVGDLAARMMAALEAAEAEGGDIRGMQSAALVIDGPTHDSTGRLLYDLRVDEHETPLAELGRLVRLRRAQVIDSQGHQHYAQGDREAGMALWAKARAEAPELEELAFWQAVTVADAEQNIEEALKLLRPMLATTPKRADWIDLLRRLVPTQIITHSHILEALAAALTDAPASSSEGQ